MHTRLNELRIRTSGLRLLDRESVLYELPALLEVIHQATMVFMLCCFDQPMMKSRLDTPSNKDCTDDANLAVDRLDQKVVGAAG